MGIEKKLGRSFSRIEPQKLGLGLLATCFLVPLIYSSMSRTNAVHFPTVNSRLAVALAPSSPIFDDVNTPQQIDLQIKSAIKEENLSSDGIRSELSEKNHIIRINGSSSSSPCEASIQSEDANVTQHLGIKNEHKELSAINIELRSDSAAAVELNSSTTVIEVTQKNNASNFNQLDTRSTQIVKPKMKPMCVLDPRSDHCKMDGDIRIHGQSSLVLFTPSQANSESNESWHIRPYARKADKRAMANVREVHIKSSKSYDEVPRCSLNHTVPAIVFSIAGYTGNYFHDFTDVLVPLFLTSHQFNGEVQFLVTNMRLWWIHKYLPILKKLSRYDIIDFDNDDRVHCFPQAIVGLRCHKELSIDPSRSSDGLSMVDFTKFMRSAYALERATPIRIGEIQRKRPRLLIISRSRTRKFANINKITRMAEKLGFEVIISEAEPDVAKFASIVNSCDVMMGVHGAGLTNLVFLPTRSVFIQIVPWGRLDWIARNYFREPAKDMNLRYLEYTIHEEESTLIDQYPRDHPVFKDPLSIHKLGWDAMGEIYLVKQNVKLNVRRFRAILKKALRLLHQ